MLARKGLATFLLSVAAWMVPQHAVILACPSCDQQDRPSPSGMLFRVTTTVVQFDAQVFDTDGRPIVSLKRDDFEVLQDGVPVVLTDVAFIARQFKRISDMRYLLRSFRKGLASGSGVSGPDGRGIERPFTEGTLGSLTSLLVDLRRLPGREVVVLLSEGVTLDVGAGDGWGASVEDRMNRLGQLGALAGVTTHCIDAAGVELTSLKDGLVRTSEQLGGRYLGGGNELTSAFERLATTEAGYYLLSYEPPPGTFVQKQPPPFRRLTVRVREKNLDVRTRRGFFGGDYR